MAKTGKSKVVETPQRPVSDGMGRRRKLTRKQNKRVAKKEAKSFAPLPSGLGLLRQAFRLLRQNWQLLGGITGIYLILSIVFASGLTNISAAFADFKNNFGSAHSLVDGLSSLISLASNSGAASSGSSGAGQSLLLILFSLVIIWALRQVLAGEKVTVKQAFYNSTTPLVPFLLVIFVIILQMIPLIINLTIVYLLLNTFYSYEPIVIIFMLILIPLAAWTLYMFSSSLLALYVVTLPGMQPRQALHSAKKLVAFRRWQVLRKFLFFMFFVAILFSAVMLPLILYVNALVVPVFFLLSTSLIVIIHTYFYSLYRGLLS